MNKIFCPILKTKRVSEKNALIALKKAIEARDDVFPYLELIQDSNESIVKKYIDIFDESKFFVEPKSSSELSALFDYNLVIPVLNINGHINESDVVDFIRDSHNLNRQIAIRINDADIKSFKVINPLLYEDDYLFVDIDKNDYFSSSFLYLVHATPKKYKTIIISNERSISYSGKDFCKYNESFPSNKVFNTSVIKAIKAGTFVFDGFGSYCAAKNDLTEEIKIAVTVYGYLLIFSYEFNNFYVSTSLNSDHISKIYNDLVEKIYVLGSDILKYMTTTPISKTMLDEAYESKKLSCTRKITIEITHYIEEIISQLGK